jgi:hypothetical protein
VAEVLVPADVELAVLTELSEGYTAVGFPGLSASDGTVGTTVPAVDPRPSEFVRVLAVGGPSLDIAYDSLTVVLEGSSTSEATAQQVCALGVGLIQAAGREGAVGGVPCRRVRLVSLPSTLPDPRVTSHSRYTATLSIDLRRSLVVPNT